MMSANWPCWLLTVVGGGLLGWAIKGMVIGPLMDDRRREVERLTSRVAMLSNQPPEVRTVEKRVEVPVERVVVKRVEVPVEKIVDRPVDNPEQLARLKALESEVAVIVGLLPQIVQLQTVSAQVEGRRLEGRLVVPINNPEQLARIKALEDEVAGIAELRAKMAELEAVSAQAVEKVVEKPLGSPPERGVVQSGHELLNQVSNVAVDLTRASADEPLEQGQVSSESPDDLKQIRGVGPALERFLHKRGVFWFHQVATWSQADIDKFEFLLPNFSGRIQRENWVYSAQVEHYKKYQQWLGDGEPPSECLDLHEQGAELHATVLAVEETKSERARGLDHPGEGVLSVEGQTVEESPDDLKQIRGVGPALERFLHKRGVFWFKQVATWSQADIDKFEFLLPNFSGRIQRENWVHSAQVEHYKKYQQWLGEGKPPSEHLDLPEQSVEWQVLSTEAGEEDIEKPIETAAEQIAGENGDLPGEEVSVDPADVDQVGVGEQSDEGQVGRVLLDDLKQIRGVGPALERFLHKRGVFWFHQVASWSQADIDKFEFLLPNFSGRIQRENWVRSAQVEYYKKYKKWLGGDAPPSTTPETPSI